MIEKLILIWSGRKDLNLRPLAPHASALPGCATPRHYSKSAKTCSKSDTTLLNKSFDR